METVEEIYKRPKSRKEGLTEEEVLFRLKEGGLNLLKPPERFRRLKLLTSQFSSPFILLLIGAGILSFFLGDRLNTVIILTIVFLSGILGFFQELGAVSALEKLLTLVTTPATLIRSGQEVNINPERIVPGDLVILRAGDVIPADCTILFSNHLFVNESPLTGEGAPVEKMERDALFLGTTVISGVVTAIVERTGKKTHYGQIAESVRFKPPETAFEIGVRSFGAFLLELTVGITVTVFVLNLFLNKPTIDALLFSLAIAVGLTPQLLPAVIMVNLSHGAKRMAKKKVIVRRLASLENFGQMNILCSDKTGTITEGKIDWISSLSPDSQESDKAARYAYLNAKFQEGYVNPLDTAILEKKEEKISGWEKRGEIPYDFERKRISLSFEYENKKIWIVKGALYSTLPLCNRFEKSDGTIEALDENRKREIDTLFAKQTSEGKRVLGIAYGEGDLEENLIFLGLLVFSDPIKPKIQELLEEMLKRGLSLKILTGDRREAAQFVSTAIGMQETQILTGKQIENMSQSDLEREAKQTSIFAELTPKQKERIVLSLRASGNVVGYLGDGVNDAIALRAADVGISVNTGSPAAKEAADIVLLKKELSVLKDGVEEGRRTFVNTLKYVFMATSANFGNMISMAGGSLFLNFLPILPKQILLTNFFSDLPEMALATDRVDPETIHAPVKWDLKLIRRFMAVFGILNSITDYMTFFVLLYWFEADVSLFRTAWTIENILTAALIVIALRTKRLIFRSKPGKILGLSVAAVVILALLLPLTSFGRLFDFKPVPLSFYGALALIIGWFFLSNEIAKYFFFRRRKPSKTEQKFFNSFSA